MKQDLKEIREKVQQIIQLTGDIQFKDGKIRSQCKAYLTSHCEECPIPCYVGIVDWCRYPKAIQNKAEEFLKDIDDVLYDSR